MIKRITNEEAEQYLACSEDYTGGFENAAFYTFTPVEDGWDEVTYYTARKKT